MKEYIGEVCLDLTYYEGTEQYSDGPIEDELLEIVKNTDRKYYNNVIAEKESWPILYHLSELRWNIISRPDRRFPSTMRRNERKNLLITPHILC